MKKQKYLGQNYMGIPGNIYLGEDVPDETDDILNKVEKSLWIVGGVLGICIIFAQVIMHVVR